MLSFAGFLAESAAVVAAMHDIESAFPTTYHNHVLVGHAKMGETSKPIDFDGKTIPADIGPIVTFEVAERAGRLRLKSLQSHLKGQGNASEVMRRIAEIADHKVVIELTASPFGDEKTRLDHDQLQRFYRKFGFEMEPGHDESLGYMIRKPK